MNLEFDRDAVGINAKKDWHDAETLGSISGAIGTVTCAGTATPVGEFLADGATSLQTAVEQALVALGMVVAECSDAAAILGSGQESAISDMDATEQAGSSAFDRISASLGGDPRWDQPI